MSPVGLWGCVGVLSAVVGVGAKSRCDSRCHEGHTPRAHPYAKNPTENAKVEQLPYKRMGIMVFVALKKAPQRENNVFVSSCYLA